MMLRAIPFLVMSIIVVMLAVQDWPTLCSTALM
jgi:hypothetical protein